MDTTNEPAAWIAIGDNTSVFFDLDCALSIDDNPTPLYRHPNEHDLGVAEATGFDKGYKAATAKTLTDEEIGQIWKDCMESPYMQVSNPVGFARAILRKANNND